MRKNISQFVRDIIINENKKVKKQIKLLFDTDEGKGSTRKYISIVVKIKGKAWQGNALRRQ